MEAKELRIGNMILWKPALHHPASTLPPVKVVVTSIEDDKITYVAPNIDNRVEPFEDDKVEKERPHKSLKEFEPIPLSPEILEMCGFDIKSSSAKYGDIKLKWKDDLMNVYFDGNRIKKDIRYFHQLQNLYFAITGEELVINTFG